MTPTDSRTQAAPAPLLDDAQTDRLAEVLRCPFEVLPEVPSTNEELVERAQRAARSGKPLPDLSLLAAEHQSAGRGRLDRQWVTGPGEALTFSLLLRPARGSGSAAVALPTQSFPTTVHVELLAHKKIPDPVSVCPRDGGVSFAETRCAAVVHRAARVGRAMWVTGRGGGCSIRSVDTSVALQGSARSNGPSGPPSPRAMRRLPPRTWILCLTAWIRLRSSSW